MEQTDILIPGQHQEWMNKLIAYVESRFDLREHMNRKIAKEIATAKYWEAYECGDASRQEYWRVVMTCFDNL